MEPSQVEAHPVIRTSTFRNLPLQRLVSRLKHVSDLKYQPLRPGEIRVLCLYPGNLGDPLRCQLKHVRLRGLAEDSGDGMWFRLKRLLGRSKSYEALSYAWGPAVFDRELFIEGHGRKPITESLYQALQHLRYSHTRRVIWADAVCLDQSQPEEVTAQVKNFSTIYRSAAGVLIWLGPADSTDDHAFAALDALDQAHQLKLRPEHLDFDDLIGRLDARRSQPAGLSRTVKVLGVAECLHAMVNLLERGYFTRMWVIQEVLSGTRLDVYAGSHCIAWPTFRTMIGAMHNMSLHCQDPKRQVRQDLQSCASKLSDLAAVFLPRHDMRFSRGRFSIENVLDIMSSFSSFGCSDPRDRVFALRQVLQIQDLPELEPDYNVEALEVYRRLIRVCLAQIAHHCKGYEFFALVGTETKQAEGPSWVPNFHSLSERSRYKHRQYSCVDYIDISPFRCSPLEFVTDIPGPEGHAESNIRVRGRVVGNVSALVHECSWPSVSYGNAQTHAGDAVAELAAWYQRCRSCAASAFAPEQLDHQLLAFLTCGYYHLNQEKITRIDSVIEDSATIRAIQQHFHHLPDGDRALCAESLRYLLGKALLSQAQSYLHGMHVVVDPSRKFAHVSIDGEMVLGWVPQTAREGDKLCVFSGAPYPFVLRVGNRTGGFELLGDAYTSPIKIRQAFGSPEARVESIAHGLFVDWNYRRYSAENRETMKNLIESLDWINLV